MVGTLASVAVDLYSMELPGSPRSPTTRKALIDQIADAFPEMEFAGMGRGRIVVWLPEPPHRQLTDEEQRQTHDRIVMKFAYNADPDNDGQRQNRTETTIWEQGSPVIEAEDLTPVFGSGDENRWLMMPYRDLIQSAARFEEAMKKKFGGLPAGDLCAKDSWGLAGDGEIECCDYGRCPTAATSINTG